MTRFTKAFSLVFLLGFSGCASQSTPVHCWCPTLEGGWIAAPYSKFKGCRGMCTYQKVSEGVHV